MPHHEEDGSSRSDAASTSFAVDVVRRLGSHLDMVQDQQDWMQEKENDNEKVIMAQEQQQQQQPPNPSAIVDVTNCTSLHSPKQLQVALSLSGEDQIINLARVTYAAYGIVLDQLLKDAERVNNQAWFWTQVEEDPGQTIIYLVQTLPARLLNLVSTLAHALGQNTPTPSSSSSSSSSTSIQPSKLDRDSIKRAWQLVQESPALVIGALFPSTIRKGQESLSIRTEQQSQKLLVATARALSPLGLTRHEARTKRRQLLVHRDELATKLGSLAQTLSSVPQEEATTSSEKMLEDLNLRLEAMHVALGVQTSSETATTTTSGLSSSLNTLLSQYISAQQNRIDMVLSSSPMGSGPPSRLARLWPTMVLAPLTTIIVVRVVTASWDTIVEKAIEARETIKGFAVNWVYEPCLKLLDTIRTGDQDGVIMSKESLNSDLQSLERMVTEFSSEKYGLKGAELDAVTQRVREGDLTTVLKIYESELKSPLKSAVTGSLIRSLLIQIQKVKVDIAVAMRGVDQLLKSQQLLFGAIGIAPAMAITYFAGGFLKNRISISLGRQGKEVGIGTRFRAWEAMRRIDRLLADPELTSGPLPPLTQGLLLLDLSLLRNLSPLLLSQVSRGRKGTAKRLRMEFLKDVRDLESTGIRKRQSKESSSDSSILNNQVGLGWHARRAAVDRMWKSWGSVMSLVEV